ncbi:helix-turn-helix domain-containing protein [Clavibacter sp. Sh2088]|uniref:helix-turn-helix domain-containing protein n=1 Tax=Clavibacter sp. Sh2088 TaxID=3397676 RepID=UPI0039DF3F7F
MTGVGGILRGLRVSADLTLEALAERSGVSVRTISDIERGVSARPRRATTYALADALGLEGSRRDRLLAAARPPVDAAGSSTRPSGSGDTAPYRLADFRGRDEEIDRLVAAATGPATGPDAEGPGPRQAPLLVVLSGAPGVGKSSIAVEAAHRIAGASRPRLFVDLGGLDDAPAEPLQVLQSLLRQLTGAEAARGELTEATAAWTEATAARPVVVVLDDAATEAQVRPVMAADPSATVLVTSRRTLAGLAGARHLRVLVLPRRDSVALLEAIVPAAQRVGADLDELAHLCGDLPLALRVAGYRIASQPASTVEDHVRRLRAEGRRLRTLVAGDTAVQAAFATSCAHLTPEARDLFRSLALLRGSSFAAPMAGAILGLDEDAALGLLDELADLGMVETMSGSRYRLHDLLRLYAAECLHADVAPDEIRRRSDRLRRWTLATASAAGRLFTEDDVPQPDLGPSSSFASEAEARAWLVAEVDSWWPEYEAAAAEGDEELVARAFPAILPFADRWMEWGRWHELFALSAEVAHRVGDRVMEAEALNDLSFMQFYGRWDPEAALASARRALEVATAGGDARGRAWALSHIAACEEARGDVEAASATARLSIEGFAALGDVESSLNPRTLLARRLLATDPEAALAAYAAIRALTSDPGTRMSAHVRSTMGLDAMAQAGKALLLLGRLDDALALADEHLSATASASGGDGRDRARALRNRGIARARLGDPTGARADLEGALAAAGTLAPAAWSAGLREELAALEAAPR